MLASSNEVREDDVNFADFRHNRRVPFVISQSSPFTTTTNPGSFPPLLPDKRSSWKRISFRKLSSQPIKLSVLKLDGSSFDIFVKKKATVGKVKQAIEAAFRQGDCKISWSHVWGQFCLCFEQMKLLRDRDSIARFGIKNGDQLQFVRHTPLYTLAGETSERLPYGLDESEGRSSSISDLCGTMKNKQTLVRNEVDEGYQGFDSNKSSFVGTMRGLFSHRTQEGPTKGNDHVVNSTTRFGRALPCDDANSNKKRDISCRSSTCSSDSVSDYVGGFGYPTGYCLK
ncbi:hypothetical protein L1987_04965 [Smallanthus sonchifolius]|uniref:Uncharacterized protein n=1 Tax=Smallanthus sonchifolius TaxID=185202 RepID=A0ACB9JU08_9ASTR|nr:hypothetical protein L1987_04965 [Smallanthus sonchifolius]